jgi:hypothetical protein
MTRPCYPLSNRTVRPARRNGILTRQDPVRSPSARTGAASGQVLLFGGGPGSDRPPQGLTWGWTGTTWTQLSPVKSPPGREYGSMTYDALNQQIVLFGGASNGIQTKEPSSTWLWNGSTWRHS